LRMSGEICAAVEKLASVAMRENEGEGTRSNAAMLRRVIGGGVAVAGGFCRNFYKSDSSLQRSRSVARFWPPHSSVCTVTVAWPATTSAQATAKRLTHKSCITVWRCPIVLSSESIPDQARGW
jgi:hypothetical protein